MARRDPAIRAAPDPGRTRHPPASGPHHDRHQPGSRAQQQRARLARGRPITQRHPEHPPPGHRSPNIFDHALPLSASCPRSDHPAMRLFWMPPGRPASTRYGQAAGASACAQRRGWGATAALAVVSCDAIGAGSNAPCDGGSAGWGIGSRARACRARLFLLIGLRVAQPLDQCLEQVPGDGCVLLHERPELPVGEPVAHEFGARGDRR